MTRIHWATKLKTYIKRSLSEKMNLPRPTSWPYISGDSFRSLAQYVLDESQSFNPRLVHTGDVIFVRTNYLEEFSKKYQPLIGIDKKFILISHNEDMEVDETLIQLIDFTKCQHWFAENLQVSHPRISPIPIGLANFYSHQNGDISLFEKNGNSQNNNGPREKFIFWDFTVGSNKTIRLEAQKELEKFPLSVHTHFDKQEEYYKYLTTITHIASPRGRGEDCNRTWEALYFGASPIVVKSVLTEHFKTLGIPLTIIKSWRDLHDETWVGKFKNHSYSFDTIRPVDVEALWMPFWANQIQQKRTSCFNQ